MAGKLEAGAPRLAAQGIAKSYGATRALAGVTLEVASGEVHALLGENGAGKSTLVRILAGAERRDAGSLLLDGAPYAPRDPGEARRSGVAMVHQERMLCAHMTVAENIFLGAEPALFTRGRRAEVRAKVEAALAQVAGGRAERRIDPDAPVGELSPAEQQLVEIARAVGQERCRVLLLDEPTSSLGADDVEALFAIVRRLRDAGLAIVYISHHMDEIRRLADRFTVIRDGRTAGTGPVEGTADADIVAMMAGCRVEELALRTPRTPRAPGEVLLEVRDLGGMRRPEVASLSLRRGEVLGIAGLMGAGRTELLRAIFGLDPVRRGEVRVGAFVGPASPSARLAQGMGMLSEDRGGEGLALGLSITDNLTLSRLEGAGPLVSPARQRAAAARWIERLGVRTRGPDERVRALSGGNQQKVALGRLLHHDVDVLLLDEPTRGVDVQSRAEIYRVVDGLAAAGKAILLVSSSVPELLGVADRVAVMRRGRLGPPRPVEELDEHQVLLAQAGAGEATSV